MLNIGIVGVGAISQKAYLPVMRSIGNVKWYMCTRNQEVLNRESKLLGRCIPCNTIEELLQFPLDGVFIHVSTKAHFEVAKQFLEKGIPVYIDKPVAPSYEKTLELYYLMDSLPTNGTYFYKKKDGVLEQCTVYLENENETALVQFNETSGANLERIEVQSPSGTYSIRNLTDLVITQGQDDVLDGFTSWDSTLYKRGFETIIHSFIIAVQTKSENPVSAKSSLLSHVICERIVTAKAPQGFLTFDVNSLE